VLANKDSAYLWQSFVHPTDTILPTNIMNKGSKLVARYAETNCSNGRFQFTLQSDGNLILETRAFPLNSAYWSTKTVLNQSGSVYLTTNSRNILYIRYRHHLVFLRQTCIKEQFLNMKESSGIMYTRKAQLLQMLRIGPHCRASYLLISAIVL
jgi:hypothetical protein